jgi:hypothetical protein
MKMGGATPKPPGLRRYFHLRQQLEAYDQRIRDQITAQLDQMQAKLESGTVQGPEAGA